MVEFTLGRLNQTRRPTLPPIEPSYSHLKSQPAPRSQIQSTAHIPPRPGPQRTI
ncbi:hypothetical protein Prudu_004087 [Prunus dulcis]|uniref:Uncharacterized protein n=1 Tax=Prunus dulcis TaxID=3755 RepID=A0A4Y1QUH7_PRUDU|nr:hypothetical protein Prudu_004087 [Prunus dulcis]